MELITNLEHWHWLILAFVLFAAEAMGAGGFLLGAAAAALLQALLNWIAPSISWEVELSVFAITSVVFSWLYFKFLKPFNDETDSPDINNRAKHMIGKVVTADQSVRNGAGKLQIGDTLWKVESEIELNAGDEVKIIDAHDMTLVLEKI